jgi:hypothetical protein
MTAAPPHRVRDLFERALDVPAGDLDAWLHREAPEDSALRTEVRSLLEYHSRADRFLDQPIVSRHPEAFADEDPLPAGTRVGGYTVLREIGRGGMGRVYLARDNRLGREVALKALAPDLTHDPVYRERLRREARAAAALNHPGICTVYALEEVDGSLYIVSELVDGRTLRDEMDTARPSGEQVARCARELAAALGAAHARGIVHRDLKPENIMRARDGWLKILDFGLARLQTPGGPVDGGTVHTRPGLLVGTPAYMAPEQLTGAPGDARSDVFAVGVVMYEYACGEHPFAASTELGRAARILESPPRPIGERVELPARLAAVIDRALRKRPEERFASAQEMLDALEAGTPPPQVADAARRPADATRTIGRLVGWWRGHQLTTMALYLIATAASWAIKQRIDGAAAVWVLVGVGAGAATAGIARGHLLFTEQVNRAGLPTERRRASSLTRVGDAVVAIGLALDALLLAPIGPVWAVLTLALAVGVALAAFLMEPAITEAVFRGSSDEGH